MDVLNKDCLALEVLSGVVAVELGKLFLGVELLGVHVATPGLYITDLFLGVDVLNNDSIAPEVLSGVEAVELGKLFLGVEAVELGKLLLGMELLSVHVAGQERLQTGVEAVELASDSDTPGDTIIES